MICSLLLNVLVSNIAYSRDAESFFRRRGVGLAANNLVANVQDSLQIGSQLGKFEFLNKMPAGSLISPALGILGASTLGLITIITDPNIRGINEGLEQFGTAGSKLGWGAAGLFGYHKTPKGLSQVNVKGKKHPDGAASFSSLTFDHTDEAKLHVESTFRSIQQGDPLKNAIFYGDAGTGKSAVSRSFAHLKGFKVYSVSGHQMNLERGRPIRGQKQDETATFKEITEWLKRVSNKNNKIILDISEGDFLLNKIASNSGFQNYFKKNYESSQENFALFFSCNFNAEVGEALKKISETSELDRRFKDRINFKTPSAKVRMLLLKNSITDTIINLSSKKSSENKSIFFEVSNFFDGVFSNHQLIKDDFVPSTEGYSHDHMIKLGQKLVQVFAIARLDELRGIDPRLTEFDYIDDKESKFAEPLDQVLAVLKRPYGDSEWVQQKTIEFMEKQQEDFEKKIPLLEKQRKFLELQRLVQTGNYELDGNGSPIARDNNQYGNQRGGRYGAQYDDRFGRGNGYEFDENPFNQ